MTETDARLGQRFAEGLAYAFELHVRQTRKGSDTPYIAHLMSVSALVIEAEGDEDEAIAALLHDAVEDQGGEVTLAEITARFGRRVAHIVDGCTDAKVVPKPPWRARKEAYVNHLSHASGSVRLVSAADKLHNATCILNDYRVLGEALWERFSGGRQSLWYYRALVAAQRSAPPEPRVLTLVDRLDSVVSALEALAD